MKREKVILTASMEFQFDIPVADITSALDALNTVLKVKAEEVMEANKKIESASVKEFNVRLIY